MATRPAAAKHTWKYAVGVIAGVAAMLALVVLLRRPEPSAVAKEASAPSASPRETALRSEEKAAVDAAIAAGRVDIPAEARALAGSVGRLLGGNAATSAMLPMSPSGTFVDSATPEFSWQPVAGAESYRVAVFDAAFRELASSGTLKMAMANAKTSWTPTSPLPAGVPLAWQVIARMPNGSEVLAPVPPRPEARFTVLDAASAARIADLRARLSDRPIALGVLLARAGLLDDAAREFDRASREPAQADLARKLRASLK
jgi:hypothetical protein